MKEFIEKLIERLEEEKQRLRNLKNNCIALSDHEVIAIEEGAYNFCKNIVNELTEEYLNTSSDTSSDTSTTNADRIRSMTDEELAEITLDYDDEYGRYWCSDGTIFGDYEYKEALKHEIDWLQSEVEGVTENE